MTTTNVSTPKSPRAYMGYTAKDLTSLARASNDPAKLTGILAYATEKQQAVAVKHPSRVAKWAKCVREVSAHMAAIAVGGTPASTPLTFVEKPLPKAKPAKKKTPTAAQVIKSTGLTREQLLVLLSKA